MGEPAKTVKIFSSYDHSVILVGCLFRSSFGIGYASPNLSVARLGTPSPSQM